VQEAEKGVNRGGRLDGEDGWGGGRGYAEAERGSSTQVPQTA